MYGFNVDEDYERQIDIDAAYDRFVDECIMCETKEEAEFLLQHYGHIAYRYLNKFFEGVENDTLNA